MKGDFSSMAKRDIKGHIKEARGLSQRDAIRYAIYRRADEELEKEKNGAISLFLWKLRHRRIHNIIIESGVAV
jgi:hypothetical protein